MIRGSGPDRVTPPGPQDRARGRRLERPPSEPSGEIGSEISHEVIDIGDIRRTEQILNAFAPRRRGVKWAGPAVVDDPAVSVLAALAADVDDRADPRLGEVRAERASRRQFSAALARDTGRSPGTRRAGRAGWHRLGAGHAGVRYVGIRTVASAAIAAVALVTSGVAAAAMHGRLPWLAGNVQRAGAAGEPRLAEARPGAVGRPDASAQTDAPASGGLAGDWLQQPPDAGPRRTVASPRQGRPAWARLNPARFPGRAFAAGPPDDGADAGGGPHSGPLAGGPVSGPPARAAAAGSSGVPGAASPGGPGAAIGSPGIPGTPEVPQTPGMAEAPGVPGASSAARTAASATAHPPAADAAPRTARRRSPARSRATPRSPRSAAQPSATPARPSAGPARPSAGPARPSGGPAPPSAGPAQPSPRAGARGPAGQQQSRQASQPQPDQQGQRPQQDRRHGQEQRATQSHPLQLPPLPPLLP